MAGHAEDGAVVADSAFGRTSWNGNNVNGLRGCAAARGWAYLAVGRGSRSIRPVKFAVARESMHSRVLRPTDCAAPSCRSRVVYGNFFFCLFIFYFFVLNSERTRRRENNTRYPSAAVAYGSGEGDAFALVTPPPPPFYHEKNLIFRFSLNAVSRHKSNILIFRFR